MKLWITLLFLYFSLSSGFSIIGESSVHKCDKNDPKKCWTDTRLQIQTPLTIGGEVIFDVATPDILNSTYHLKLETPTLTCSGLRIGTLYPTSCAPNPTCLEFGHTCGAGPCPEDVVDHCAEGLPGANEQPLIAQCGFTSVESNTCPGIGHACYSAAYSFLPAFYSDLFSLDNKNCIISGNIVLFNGTTEIARFDLSLVGVEQNSGLFSLTITDENHMLAWNDDFVIVHATDSGGSFHEYYLWPKNEICKYNPDPVLCIGQIFIHDGGFNDGDQQVFFPATDTWKYLPFTLSDGSPEPVLKQSFERTQGTIHLVPEADSHDIELFYPNSEFDEDTGIFSVGETGQHEITYFLDMMEHFVHEHSEHGHFNLTIESCDLSDAAGVGDCHVSITCDGTPNSFGHIFWQHCNNDTKICIDSVDTAQVSCLSQTISIGIEGDSNEDDINICIQSSDMHHALCVSTKLEHHTGGGIPIDPPGPVIPPSRLGTATIVGIVLGSIAGVAVLVGGVYGSYGLYQRRANYESV